MKSVKPPRRRSITFRMTLAVCAFVILFQSLLAILTLIYFKREFKQSISSQQFTLLTVASQDIDQKLKSAQNMLLAISREVPPEILTNPDAAQRWLDKHYGTRSIFDNGLFLFSKRAASLSKLRTCPTGADGTSLSGNFTQNMPPGNPSYQRRLSPPTHRAPPLFC